MCVRMYFVSGRRYLMILLCMLFFNLKGKCVFVMGVFLGIGLVCVMVLVEYGVEVILVVCFDDKL